MKKIIYPLIFASAIITSAFTFVNNSTWNLKEDSYTVKFSGTKVEGVFKGLKATINFDEVNTSNSKIVASIDPTTVNTGNGMKNKHVREGLETDKYSQIKFESTSIVKKGGAYEATGKLLLMDVTKEITFPFTFTKNDEGGIFTGKISIIPAEYHITKSGTPSEIEIQLTIPVTK